MWWNSISHYFCYPAEVIILNHLIFIPYGIRFCFVNDYGAALFLAFS